MDRDGQVDRDRQANAADGNADDGAAGTPPAADRERRYFRLRAEEERDAAAEASCMVKDVHLELAERYDELGEAATERPD